jgi:DNA-binding CsgD family transcriptional regulator
MYTEAGLSEQSQSEHDDGPGMLLDAVERSLRRGDVESALGLLPSLRRRFTAPDNAAAAIKHGLTERETTTLALLSDAALSQKDMARLLGISHNTLKTHLRSVYQKIGAHSRGEAIERSACGRHQVAVTIHRHRVAV